MRGRIFQVRLKGMEQLCTTARRKKLRQSVWSIAARASYRDFPPAFALRPSPLFPLPWSRLSPAAADPNVSTMVMRPMASYPHGSVPGTECVTAAYPDPDPSIPIPTSGHPDVCGARGRRNSFHLDSGRGHRGCHYCPGRWEIRGCLGRCGWTRVHRRRRIRRHVNHPMFDAAADQCRATCNCQTQS